MLKRLWAVLSLYLRCPVIMIQAGIFIFLVSTTFFISHYLVEPNEELKLGSTVSWPVDSVTGDRLTRHSAVWHTDKLGTYSNQELNEAKIEFLVLSTIGKENRVVSLEMLERLPELTHLDLTECMFSEELSELPDLPQLEMILLPEQEPRNLELLEQLARYPHLKTLVINPWKHEPVVEEQVVHLSSILETLPSLEKVYVGTTGFAGSSFSFTNDVMNIKMEQQQFSQELAGMQLLRSHSEKCLVLPAVSEIVSIALLQRLAMFFYICTFAMLVHHGLKYLSLPGGSLFPHHQAYHLVAMLILTLAGILIASQGLYQPSYDFSALMSVLLSPIISLTIVIWLLPYKVEAWVWIQAIPTALAIPLISTPFYISQFLVGANPWIESCLWMMILISTVCLRFVLIKTLNSLRLSGLDISLPIEFKQNQEFKQHFKNRVSTSKMETRVDRNLLQSVNRYQTQSGVFGRISLFSRGNPVSGTDSLLLLVLGVILVELVLWVGKIGVPEEYSIAVHATVIWLSLYLLPIVNFLGPTRIWLRRSRAMKCELLFPLQRRQLKKAFAIGIFRDQLPVTLAVIALLSWISIRSEVSGLNTFSSISIAWFGALALSSVSYVFTLGAILLLDWYERNRVKITLCFVLLLAPSALIGVRFSSESLNNPHYYLNLGLGLFSLAVFFFGIIWFRMDEKEWGLQ